MDLNVIAALFQLCCLPTEELCFVNTSQEAIQTIMEAIREGHYEEMLALLVRCRNLAYNHKETYEGTSLWVLAGHGECNLHELSWRVSYQNKANRMFS